MALRNQPYIPLYIQDFMTDEKLIECSAQSTGVYIRILCIMHKSSEYGTVLLKQKDKQSDHQIKNFACKLGRQMPYDLIVIEDSLNELIDEKVIQVEGDKLMQKRMIKDNELSLKRSEAGSKGGKKTQFAKSKIKANPEIENEYEIENKYYIIVGDKKISNVADYLKAHYAIQMNELQVILKRDIEKLANEFVKEKAEEAFEDANHVKNSFKIFCRGKDKKTNSNNIPSEPNMQWWRDDRNKDKRGEAAKLWRESGWIDEYNANSGTQWKRK